MNGSKCSYNHVATCDRSSTNEKVKTESPRRMASNHSSLTETSSETTCRLSSKFSMPITSRESAVSPRLDMLCAPPPASNAELRSGFRSAHLDVLSATLASCFSIDDDLPSLMET